MACTQISVAAGIQFSQHGFLPANLARCIWLQLEVAKWLYNQKRKKNTSIYRKLIVFRAFLVWIISADPLSDLEKKQSPGLELPFYRQGNHGLKGLFGAFNTKH